MHPRRVPLIALLVLLGCESAPPPQASPAGDAPASGGQPAAAPAEVPEEALARAREAAGALGTRLQGRLLAALDQGGPPQAVEVCSVEAQEIARSLSVDGALVRRVSLRTRNPENDPDPHERGILEAWDAVWGEEEVPGEVWQVTVQEGGRTLRYLRPIPVAGPCTTCHGEPEEMVPELLALIRRLYPEDRAVGYASGDLRGAISVSIPLDPSARR